VSLESEGNSTVIKKVADTNEQMNRKQIERLNKVCDKLQERMVALDVERNAPERVQLRKKASLPAKK
jgi:hypothetical protein